MFIAASILATFPLPPKNHLILNQYQSNRWKFALYDLLHLYIYIHILHLPFPIFFLLIFHLTFSTIHRPLFNATILFSNLAAIDVLSSKNMQLRD